MHKGEVTQSPSPSPSPRAGSGGLPPPTVLFLDDDPHVLQGLSVSLQGQATESTIESTEEVETG